MKDKNEPVLFVNSCSVYRSPEKSKNKTKLHRLDDVKVLLSMKKEIEIEVTLDSMVISGMVKEIKEYELVIEINNKDTIINLENIKGIKIISTK